ncbi:MAG: GNAT family N-acetyltransferase [Clostridia bacterium]|nr:GNAT family N-acetyltransferase [Clostridia bacterium]MDR3645065.1 GNAT family N-acetyltransferase [Clostridia bacterium]
MEITDISADDYLISKDKRLLQLDRVQGLLEKSYWAQNRPKDTIEKSIENSLCYGVYLNTVQVGFARVMTDYATAYYLCDVIIDEAHRGKGLGKKLIDTIIHDDALKSLSGILATKDAHGLYEQFGFAKGGDRYMSKKAD